ncbi:hypothetical protein SMY84_001791 [Cronobacter turicensis]|nr:hypothetical protein [Cronobacter turicensis]
MSQKNIVLSGAASDVLYALFTRGALASGDLPSKSGASELRENGLAETRSVAAKRQTDEHFTFLTAEGQKFAIQHLVETDFGRKNITYHGVINLSISVDADTLLKELSIITERLEKNNDPERLSQLVQKTIAERLNKELQPGGLLHKR